MALLRQPVMHPDKWLQSLLELLELLREYMLELLALVVARVQASMVGARSKGYQVDPAVPSSLPRCVKVAVIGCGGGSSSLHAEPGKRPQDTL